MALQVAPGGVRLPGPVSPASVHSEAVRQGDGQGNAFLTNPGGWEPRPSDALLEAVEDESEGRRSCR